MVQHSQISVIEHASKRRVKNHMVLSIDAEKAFDKIQHPFLIKTLQSVGIEGTFLDFLKTICNLNAHREYHSQWEKLRNFPLRSGT